MCIFSKLPRKKKKRLVPKLCRNVVNLLLVLQDPLTVSLKQQRGHTQVVGVKAFELAIEAVDSCQTKSTRGRYWWRRWIWTQLIYLSDIKLLQTIQERCENGRHLRLQSVTCDMRQESERSLRNGFSETHSSLRLSASFSALQRGKELYLFGDFKQKEEI